MNKISFAALIKVFNRRARKKGNFSSLRLLSVRLHPRHFSLLFFLYWREEAGSRCSHEYVQLGSFAESFLFRRVCAGWKMFCYQKEFWECFDDFPLSMCHFKTLLLLKISDFHSFLFLNFKGLLFGT